MDSLNDTELEWALFPRKLYTVDEAVQIVLEYEAFEMGHSRKNHKRIESAEGRTIYP